MEIKGLNVDEQLLLQKTYITKGRLTSGNKALHVRRKPIADILDDVVHMVSTMMANWPEEYKLPADHNIHELLTVIGVVSSDLKEPSDD